MYVVGLDTHIGFLVKEPGKSVRFCHSTRRNRRKGVVCEIAKSSKSLKSRYTVLGKLDSAALVHAWLSGDLLPAARKHQPQPTALIPPKKRPKKRPARPSPRRAIPSRPSSERGTVRHGTWP